MTKRGKIESQLLAQRPSACVRERSIYFSLETEETLLPKTFRYIGDEHLVYLTDIPHWDTEFQKICRGYRTEKIFPTKPKISYCTKTQRRFTRSSYILLNGGAYGSSDVRTQKVLAQTDLMNVAIKYYYERGENALHTHPTEDNVFDGEATFYDKAGAATVLTKGKGILLPKGWYYRFHNIGGRPLIILRCGAD